MSLAKKLVLLIRVKHRLMSSEDTAANTSSFTVYQSVDIFHNYRIAYYYSVQIGYCELINAGVLVSGS
jgi:hypothetical protein